MDMNIEEMDDYEVLRMLNKLELLNERTPAFYLKRPQIVGAMSCYRCDAFAEPQFRYAKIPNSYPLDLNKGFEQYRFHCGLNIRDSIAPVLKYLMENAIDAFGQNRLTAAPGVVAQRGVLYRIMLIPYRLYESAYNDHTTYAIKYNNVLFLTHPYHTEQLKTKNDTYHFKFEQYCSAESPEEEPTTDEPVDENFVNYCILRTKLQEFNILYSGEMKHILSDQKVEDLSNLEKLNKTRFAFTKLIWDKSNFNLKKHPKCREWWAQCYLSNVDDILFGRKQPNGFIHLPVEHIHAKDLPTNCTWKPHIAIRFLHTFLTMVQDTMSSVNCPYTVYEFAYDSKLLGIKYKVHTRRSELSFLSDEFIDWLQNRNL